MTNSENNNKLIKDWIRPLQKSLTIENENKFINTLGREKYFNDYLHESLQKLDNLNIPEEYLRIFDEFSKKYNEYNKLDENQRKRLIIDTRKNLYKLGKTLEKENINQIDISPYHHSLKIFNLIDKSLENLLLNLSYKINQELFKANLIKKMISKNSFDYLVGKNFMMKHPYPFVINFELNLNRSSLIGNNFPSIIFFNISTVELEFKNLNLSIQRNKINELKNQFQRLIKKETYWRQKEITLNKIS